MSKHPVPKMPTLYITQFAWMKIGCALRHVDTEIAWWGITHPDNPMYVQDIIIPHQCASSADVEFDQEQMAQHLFELMDLDIPPRLGAHIHGHSHPGNSAEPSGTDDDMFYKEMAHDKYEWIVSLIVAQDLSHTCRGRIPLSTGHQLTGDVPVVIVPQKPEDTPAWDPADLIATIKERVKPSTTTLYRKSNYVTSHGHGYLGYDLWEADDLDAIIDLTGFKMPKPSPVDIRQASVQYLRDQALSRKIAFPPTTLSFDDDIVSTMNENDLRLYMAITESLINDGWAFDAAGWYIEIDPDTGIIDEAVSDAAQWHISEGSSTWCDYLDLYDENVLMEAPEPTSDEAIQAFLAGEDTTDDN
jgi:hypothetical protein